MTSQIGPVQRRHLLRDDHYRAVLGSIPFVYGALWVVGLGGLFWPLFAIPSVVYLVDRRITRLAFTPLAVGLLLIISIPIGVVAFGQAGRSVAALGNAAVWVCVAALMVAAAQPDPRIRGALIIARLGAFQAVVVALGLVSYPGEAPVPLGLLPDSLLPSGLDTFASSRIVYDDWLGGEALRTVGIMANPTWAGAFAVITLGACVHLLILRKHRLLVLVAGAGAFVTIALSLSRAVIILGAVAVVAGLISLVRKRSKRLGAALILVLLGAVVLVLLLNWSDLVEAALELNSDRVGSWESRASIYSATLEGIRNHPLILLGYGIKPQVPGLVASIATHSSFLSVLFRGGILCLLLLIVFAADLLLGRWRRSDAIGVFVVLFIFSWGILEDLDGGHLLLLGLLLGAEREPSG